jgi:hypothetical protein
MLLRSLCLLLALSFGCTTAEVLPEPPAPRPWAGDDVRPALDHPWFDERPELADLSLYATEVSGPTDDRPDHMHRGAFAVGNGLTFSLLGLTDPLNTLHSMVGPVYEKGARFFPDVAVGIEVDGVLVEPHTEAIARVRGSSVVITRSDADEVTFYTVDFGPRPADVGPLDVPPVVARRVLVQSTASTDIDVAIRLLPRSAPTEEQGLLLRAHEDDGRWLGYLAPGGTWTGDGDAGHRLDLGTLAANGAADASIVFATATSVDDLVALDSSTDEATVDGWLSDTQDWWSAFSARGVQVSTGDPRIEDLYDGMRVGVRIQQSAAGAVCPMSQYTLVWLRDTIGPVRFYLRAGLHEEAQAALDYLHLCASVRGDLSNACESGLTIADLNEEPDWSALGPFSGKMAAEAPSYVPLMYQQLVAFTGDRSSVVQRWPYLRRALLGQPVYEGGVQPFSGDETFRNAMSAALGYPVDMSYEDDTWSANSAFLLSAASAWMAEQSRASELDADAATFDALEAQARAALSGQFLQEDGHYAPFVLHADDITEVRPFEDVNLKALWSGALASDDPVALSNLDVLRDFAGRGDGTVQSPLDPSYVGLMANPVVEEGLNTGMVAGYYLWNLAAIGDVEAYLAFDALHAYADEAGQYGEYMVFDDLSAFSPVYDGGGVIGDYTARHRPWEGGINLDAYLYWLAGPLAADGALHLRPHLPGDQPTMTMSGLRAAHGAASFELIREAGSLTLRVTSQAEEPFTLRVDLPMPADGEEILSAAHGGQQAGTTMRSPGGELYVSFPEGELGPGETGAWNIQFR